MPLLEEHSLALFRFLLPSLGRTAECGFNYLAVIGYDVGDEFFDTELGKERVRIANEMESIYIYVCVQQRGKK